MGAFDFECCSGLMFLKDSPDCCAENRPQGAKGASGLCQDGSRGGGEKWSGSGCIWRYSQYNFLTDWMRGVREREGHHG